jgi:hypothetical protein
MPAGSTAAAAAVEDVEEVEDVEDVEEVEEVEVSRLHAATPKAAINTKASLFTWSIYAVRVRSPSQTAVVTCDVPSYR